MENGWLSNPEGILWVKHAHKRQWSLNFISEPVWMPLFLDVLQIIFTVSGTCPWRLIEMGCKMESSDSELCKCFPIVSLRATICSAMCHDGVSSILYICLPLLFGSLCLLGLSDSSPVFLHLAFSSSVLVRWTPASTADSRWLITSRVSNYTVITVFPLLGLIIIQGEDIVSVRCSNSPGSHTTECTYV